MLVMEQIGNLSRERETIKNEKLRTTIEKFTEWS